jgi:hypothetical protein
VSRFEQPEHVVRVVDEMELSERALLAREIVEPFVTDSEQREVWLQQAAEGLNTEFWLDSLLCLVAFGGFSPQFFEFALGKATGDFGPLVSVLRGFLERQFPRQSPWFDFLWKCYESAPRSEEDLQRGDCLLYGLIEILVAFVQNDPAEVGVPYEQPLDQVLGSWIGGELHYLDGSLLAALLRKVESDVGIEAVITNLPRIAQEVTTNSRSDQSLDGVCAIMEVLVVKYDCRSAPGFLDALGTLIQGVVSDDSTAAAGFFDLLCAWMTEFPGDIQQLLPSCLQAMTRRFSELARQEVTLKAIARLILVLGLDKFDDPYLFEFMESGGRIFDRNPSFFRDQKKTRKPEPLNELMNALLRHFSGEAIVSK